MAAEGKFRGQIERVMSFRDQTVNHNLGSNVRVVKLLAFLGALRRAGVPLAGGFTCLAATRQDFRSKHDMTMHGLPTGSMEAAHFMPGQVYLHGRLVWSLTRDPATRDKVEALFAEVEHLATVFNQADTAAEAKGQGIGLCAVLAAACRALASAPVAAGADGGLRLGFETWTANAMIALHAALGGKVAKGVMPELTKNTEGDIDTSLRAREAADHSTWNRDEASRALGYCIADQQQRDWRWVQSACRSSIAEMLSDF